MLGLLFRSKIWERLTFQGQSFVQLFFFWIPELLHYFFLDLRCEEK